MEEPEQEDPKLQQQQQQQEKRKEIEAQRHIILSKILKHDARERLSRIRLVRPEKAVEIENHLFGLAQSGRLQGQIDENMLIAMLKNSNEQKTKITYKRRAWDDEKDQDGNEEEKDDDDDDDDDELHISRLNISSTKNNASSARKNKNSSDDDDDDEDEDDEDRPRMRRF